MMKRFYPRVRETRSRPAVPESPSSHPNYFHSLSFSSSLQTDGALSMVRLGAGYLCSLTFRQETLRHQNRTGGYHGSRSLVRGKSCGTRTDILRNRHRQPPRQRRARRLLLPDKSDGVWAPSIPHQRGAEAYIERLRNSSPESRMRGWRASG
jgi:hypothetical protein